MYYLCKSKTKALKNLIKENYHPGLPVIATRRFGELGGKQWQAPQTRVSIISILISHNDKIRTYWCFWLKGIIISKQFMNSMAVFVLTLTCLCISNSELCSRSKKLFYYQVKSGRPITFVNKLAATFQNLGFLLEILSILAQDYKRINSTGLKTLRWCHIF